MHELKRHAASHRPNMRAPLRAKDKISGNSRSQIAMARFPASIAGGALAIFVVSTAPVSRGAWRFAIPREQILPTLTRQTIAIMGIEAMGTPVHCLIITIKIGKEIPQL